MSTANKENLPYTALLFSIITPTFNCAAQLQRTIDSLAQQDGSLFEFIIVDGASTDGTLDVIKNHKSEARHTVRWVSKKDKGIYDAMNKGIEMARGKFVLFLGAGDLLQPNILGEVEPLLPHNPLSLFYGNALMEGGHVYGARFDKCKIAKLNICHQAIFYGRDVFGRVGKYDLRYRVLADHALNIKCFGDERIEKIYTDRIIAEYEADGFSAHHRDDLFFANRKRLIRRHLGRKALLTFRVFEWEIYGPAPLRFLIGRTKETLKILLHRPRGQRKLPQENL